MNLQLGAKRALITGSNTGIGKGIATVLAREGVTVVVHGRNREPLFMDLGRFPFASERLGRPEDVGALVAYLASPMGTFVTGANYRIDGGQCQSVN